MRIQIKNFREIKYILYLTILLTGLLFLMLFYFLNSTDKVEYGLETKNLESLAAEVVERCSSSNFHPTCYENEIPRLMLEPENLTMDEAFKLAKMVQNRDSTFPYCHVLGHKIAAIETRKNPDGWKEVINRCPSGLCSNGCVHGAFQERYRAEFLPDDEIEKIKNELAQVCRSRENWKVSGIAQGSCYHALGHLFTYLTNGKLTKAVSLCEELAESENGADFRSVCFDGVFMQIYQPLEPEDFALAKRIAPPADKVSDFCSQFEEKPNSSCWIESWPLKIENLKTAPGLTVFCSSLKEPYRQRCYDSMFYIMPIQFRFNTERFTNFCLGFSWSQKGECFAQYAQRLIQNDNDNIEQAVEFCNTIDKYDESHRCYEELATKATFNFIPQSPEHQKMCQSLPEQWTTICKNNPDKRH